MDELGRQKIYGNLAGMAFLQNYDLFQHFARHFWLCIDLSFACSLLAVRERPAGRGWRLQS
jgi:hypothetical protein